jgi:hypothetical protein
MKCKGDIIRYSFTGYILDLQGVDYLKLLLVFPILGC